MTLTPVVRLVSLLFVALVAFRTSAQAKQPSTNLVFNPGFENGTAGWGLSANGATAEATVDNSVSHSGKNSLRFTNASQQQPNVFYRAFQSMPGVQPYTTYRISCWVKGDSSGDLFIGGGPGWATRQACPQGTFDWTQVSMEWSTGATAEDFEMMLVSQSPTKACWIDDVEFAPIRTDEAKLAELRTQIQSSLDKRKQRLAALSTLAQQLGLVDDAYVKLGVGVAKRFISRIETLGALQNMSWSNLQLDEVDGVLKETEDRVNRLPAALPGTIAWPDGGPVEVRDGVFYSRKAGQKASSPCFFGGMGHFGGVFHDLPNFRDLGVNLIQDGRHGPSSLADDGSLTDESRRIATDLDSAASNGVKVDFLLSPHFFPTWAYAKSPDIRNGNVGFIDFNVDHPFVREVIEHWLRTIVPTVKNKSALFSYCLTNEPAYVQSGKDPYSRPKFVKFLQQTHGDISKLNAIYGTQYKSFGEVVVPTRYDIPTEINECRAYFDWCRFNQMNFAEWHRWMNDIVKSIDPQAKTHAKVLVLHAFERTMSHFGVDPELICEITDLAGCDNMIGYDNTSLTGWLNNEFYYDLMNSFRNQPVFNSESHFIPDGLPPVHIPAENSRAVIWQGVLHHMGATTIWVWDEPQPGLLGNIALRPANIYGVGQALLDANRLSNELATINQAKPRVALLYSQPSIYWEPSYGAQINNLHTYLKYAGEKVTFVSERQLAAGKAAVDVIFTSRATHVADETFAALKQFVTKGGRVILCGNDDLRYDQYHRERKLAAEFQNARHLNLDDGPKIHGALVDALRQSGLEVTQLQDLKTKADVNGVEYRIVGAAGGAKLIPLMNFTAQPMTVCLSDSNADATDLLSGQSVKLSRIQLQPMIPLLLRCNVR